MLVEITNLKQKLIDFENGNKPKMTDHWTHERLINDKNAELEELVAQNRRLEQELALYRRDINQSPVKK